MKAFKIDVISKLVYAVDIPNDSIEHIYKALDCDTFDVIMPKGSPKGLSVYIDDEGLYRNPPLGVFAINGYPQALSGHGLVLGVDSSGNSCDAPISLKKLKENVHWLEEGKLPKPGFKLITLP